MFVAHFRRIRHIFIGARGACVDDQDAFERKLYVIRRLAEKAISEYQRAIELSPSNLMAYNNLGVLYDKMGLYDEAIGEFQRALEIDPTDANALKNLESAKKNKTVMEEREGQIAELRREVDAHPENPKALYNLGRLYAFYDEKDQALEWINKALEKGEQDMEYINLDPAL